jgi:hypothetical protein
VGERRKLNHAGDGRSRRGGHVLVYHVSAELSLRRIVPRYSPKFGERGVFVTRSFQSVVHSWAHYVSGKRRKGSSRRRGFDPLAIYAIWIPVAVFDEAEAHHEAVAAQASGSPDALGAWGWDVETFVPERMARHLTPSSRTVMRTFDVERVDRAARRRGTFEAVTSGQSGRREAMASEVAYRNEASRLWIEARRALGDVALRRRRGNLLAGAIDEDLDKLFGLFTEKRREGRSKAEIAARRSKLSAPEIAQVEAVRRRVRRVVDQAASAWPIGRPPDAARRPRWGQPKVKSPRWRDLREDVQAVEVDVDAADGGHERDVDQPASLGLGDSLPSGSRPCSLSSSV